MAPITRRETLFFLELGLGLSKGGLEGGGGGDFDVGSDSGCFPVGFRYGLTARFRDGHSVVIVDAMPYASVGAANGGFADDGGAL